jgi:hypothetical protein
MNTIIKVFGVTALDATAVAGPLYAQWSAHRADSSNSVGRIFLSSTKRPQLQNNIAVTRVSAANVPSG